MYRIIFIGALLLFGEFSFGQDTLFHQGDTLTYFWKKNKVLKIKSSDIWSVDKLENVYITDGASIKKFDSTGVLKFQQSIKSYGKATQLAPVNSMKLIYFSQEQQNLCFLDNTLTVTEDCIDLVDYNIFNAEWIATSSRPELLWVYDNVNSTLKLISLNAIGHVNLEILNVKGILNLEGVDQLFEVAQNLYVFDRSKGVFQLDFYGGLLNHWSSENEISIDVGTDKRLYRLQKSTLVAQGLFAGIPGEKTKFSLPMEGIKDFRVVGSNFYFRTTEGVYKYTLHFNK